MNTIYPYQLEQALLWRVSLLPCKIPYKHGKESRVAMNRALYGMIGEVEKISTDKEWVSHTPIERLPPELGRLVDGMVNGSGSSHATVDTADATHYAFDWSFEHGEGSLLVPSFNLQYKDDELSERFGAEYESLACRFAAHFAEVMREGDLREARRRDRHRESCNLRYLLERIRRDPTVAVSFL